MSDDELNVDWNTVTWSELIAAIRERDARRSFAAPACSAPDSAWQKERSAMEGEIIMLRACNKQLVFQEQQQRAISNNLRAELAKLKALNADISDLPKKG